MSAMRRPRQRLCDTILRGQDAGTVRGDVDPHAFAQLLLALVLGAHTASEIGAPCDADRVGEDVLRMLAPIGVAPVRKRR